MHETFETVQLNSRKVVKGDLRVFFALTSLFLTVLSQNIHTYVLSLLIFSVLSYQAAGKVYLRILRIPMYFLLPSLFVVLIVTKGEVMYKLWIFEISKEGVNLAIITGLRAFASLSILLYLILTTTIPEFVSALRKLRVPEFIIEIAVLIYRCIQILLDEAERLNNAATSRLGYVNKRRFVSTAALLAYSIFLKSLSRSEKMERSMSARCYSGKMPVRSEKSSGWAIAILVLIAIAIGCLI